MSSAYLLIPLGLLLMAAAVAALFWAADAGQFDDVDAGERAALSDDPLPEDDD